MIFNVKPLTLLATLSLGILVVGCESSSKKSSSSRGVQTVEEGKEGSSDATPTTDGNTVSTPGNESTPGTVNSDGVPVSVVAGNNEAVEVKPDGSPGTDGVVAQNQVSGPIPGLPESTNSEEKTVRTGPQYRAAVLKLMSTDQQSSDELFQLIHTALPSSPDARNVDDSTWIAAARFASKNCDDFLVKKKEELGDSFNHDDLTFQLLSGAVIDPAQRLEFGNIIAEFGTQVPDADTRFKANCTLIAASMLFY